MLIVDRESPKACQSKTLSLQSAAIKQVAKSVDALDVKSSTRKGVEVRSLSCTSLTAKVSSMS